MNQGTEYEEIRRERAIKVERKKQKSCMKTKLI